MTQIDGAEQDPWYAGASRQTRIAKAIERSGLDALVALTPENAEYLSGRPSTVATLWQQPGLVAVAVNVNGDLAVAAGDHEADAYQGVSGRFAHPLWIEHLDLRGSGETFLARVAAARPAGVIERPAQFDCQLLLDAVASAILSVTGSPARIGTELTILPRWIADGLRERLPKTEFVDAKSIFDDLRAVKDAGEIANLRLAAELTEIGIAAARDALRDGLSALVVSAAYQSAVWNAAAADPRFAAMRQAEGLVSVGDGSGAALAGPGETVKLDMQVDVGGYHSDIGRTYALAPTADQQSVYDALRDALDAAVTAIAPGVPFSEVWAAGIMTMREAGFANYSRGHLGHSVGLAHNYEEPPFIAAEELRPLAPGMVISVEMPYYLRGLGAFQMERMVLVRDHGCEVLDRLPFILDPSSTSRIE